MRKAALFGVVVLCVVIVCNARPLDIHVKLPDRVRDLVVNISEDIHVLAPHDSIDFQHDAQPHITLYLTDFLDSNINALIETVRKLLPSLCSCLITMSQPVVSGSYLLWNTEKSSCFQALSDKIVLATYQLRNLNQSLPDWVNSMPDPPRSEMIWLFNKYGSPTVFDQFAPHITVAWDDVDNLTSVLQKVPFPSALKFEPPVIGIGTVGPYGTVLQDKDLFNSTFSC